MSRFAFPTRLTPPFQELCARVVAWGLLLSLCGCVGPQRNWVRSQQPDDLPAAHSVRGPGFVLLSDFPVDKDGPLIDELTQLQNNVRETLHLPPQRDRVVVYLFENRDSYRRYMLKTWPDLPERRAYFIGTSHELAVYSYQGPSVEEDLRHEMTHGLLHASLTTVPLWLDEGLAEYFEVRGPVGIAHPEHAPAIQRLLTSGWAPSLPRLESIEEFDRLTQQDYAESWSWVHYLLHSDAERRDTLLRYLASLRNASSDGLLQNSLPRDSHVPMADHIRRLPGDPSSWTFRAQGG